RIDEETAVYTNTCPGDVYARAYPATVARSDNPIFDCRESGRRPPPVSFGSNDHA
ncbi:hypothetical protein ALC62_08455, partial [Cyphomyrmex costatus]